MTKLSLVTQQNDLAKIHLTKKVITDLESCEDEVNENYDGCMKSKIIAKSDSVIECTPVTLKHLGLTPENCSSEVESQKALNQFRQIANEQHGCLKKCSWERFDAG